MYHDGTVGGDLNGKDRAGEAGGKGDHAGASHGGVAVLKQCLACEHTAKGLADAAVGGGFHLHVGAHPAHTATLGDHLFTGVQIADDNG